MPRILSWRRQLLLAAGAVIGWFPGATGSLMPTNEGCYPQWFVEGKDCPNGSKLPGDVTWSNNPDMFLIEKLICVFYGYSPFIVCGLAVLEVLIRRGTREITFLAFLAMITLINEIVWKNLTVQQRPPTTCASSCGFPSGHATISMGCLTLLFLDLAFRINPLGPTDSFSGSWCFRTVSVIPIHGQPTITNHQFVVVFLFWCAVLGPVPLARVWSGDHTPQQVFVGGFLGIIEAIVFVQIFRAIAKHIAKTDRHDAFHEVDVKRGCGCLRKNILLPWWHLKMPRVGINDPEDLDEHVEIELRRLKNGDDLFQLAEGYTAVVRGKRLKGSGWVGVAWKDKRHLAESESDEESDLELSDVDSEKGTFFKTGKSRRNQGMPSRDSDS